MQFHNKCPTGMWEILFTKPLQKDSSVVRSEAYSAEGLRVGGMQSGTAAVLNKLKV